MKDAKKCKHCGADLRSWPARHKILTALGILFVLGLISSAANPSSTKQTPNDQPPASVTSTTPTSGSQPVASAPTTTTKAPTPKQAPTSTKPAPAPTPTPAPTPAKPPAPTFASFGDGNYAVGTDIQPGTYRTRSAPPGGTCYYARLAGFSGNLSDIIANANTSAPAVVTIAATDKGFTTSGCGTWTKNLSQITASQTSFGSGIFIVGTDILPGTYRSSGGDSCYYARLAGFSGNLHDVIANENTGASAIVTISSSDKGFDSSRCGTWTQVGP